MPYKSEKIPLSKSQDRRYKLIDRQAIIELYREGGTFRGLARIFNVDRKTIKNIVLPDYYQKQLEQKRGKGLWKLYYNREKNNVIHKEYRHYKQKLYKLGLLKGGENK